MDDKEVSKPLLYMQTQREEYSDSDFEEMGHYYGLLQIEPSDNHDHFGYRNIQLGCSAPDIDMEIVQANSMNNGEQTCKSNTVFPGSSKDLRTGLENEKDVTKPWEAKRFKKMSDLKHEVRDDCNPSQPLTIEETKTDSDLSEFDGLRASLSVDDSGNEADDEENDKESPRSGKRKKSLKRRRSPNIPGGNTSELSPERQPHNSEASVVLPLTKKKLSSIKKLESNEEEDNPGKNEPVVSLKLFYKNEPVASMNEDEDDAKDEGAQNSKPTESPKVSRATRLSRTCRRTEPYIDDLKPFPMEESKTIVNYCQICEKQFQSRTTLKNHTISYHHPAKSKKYRVCSICNIDMKTFYHLLRHELRHRSDDMKGYKCSICSKVLKRKSSLRHHVASFHTQGDFRCGLCDENLNTKHEFEEHQNNCFNFSKTFGFQCAICDKSFASRSRLKDHHRKVHFKINHLCDLCFQTFDSGFCLQEHKKICSLVKSDSHCEICQKQVSNLQIHNLQYHTKGKFLCDWCNKSKRTIYQLKQHKKTCLPSASGKYYNCKVCDKGFGKKTSLKYHELTHKK